MISISACGKNTNTNDGTNSEANTNTEINQDTTTTEETTSDAKDDISVESKFPTRQQHKILLLIPDSQIIQQKM